MSSQGYSTRLRFIIIATVLGNLLQWFDFSLFGLMLPLFMKIFFPGEDKIIFFLLFALGALARPIGGIAFGYLGDTSGRKTALVRTILFMTIPIFLVALLPTAKEIGALAGAFLVLLYLFQGFCVGGEFPGSLIFLTESSPPRLRGYLGVWAYFGVSLGMFLVAIDVYELSRNLSLEALQSWGWRVPFFMGAFVGVIGIFMRHFLHETPIFSEAKHVGHLVKKPLLHTLKKEKKALIRGSGLYLLDALGFNLVLVYSNFYFINQHHLSLEKTFQINLLSLLSSLIFFPLMGKVGNFIGNVRLARWSAGGVFFLSLPFYSLIFQNKLYLILIGQCCLNIILVSYVSNMPILLHRLYPTEVRYTCLGIVINCTVAIFGGTAPILAHLIMNHTSLKLFPALYLMLGSLVALYSLRGIEKKLNS